MNLKYNINFKAKLVLIANFLKNFVSKLYILFNILEK